MDFDLEFWLVAATAVSGVIWLLYALFSRNNNPEEESVLLEYARSFFPVLLAVLLLRSFVIEPFRIPSGSMLPTLEIGDFILVNKFAYGLRLPVLHDKILEVGEPQRGDVVVFRYPENPKVDYIKRLIGVPGDVVEWNNKTLRVNGIELDRSTIGEYIALDQHNGSRPTTRLKEDLLGVSHDILIVPNTGGKTGSITVPEGHYFMMGDNRDMSNDSRMWGLVPEANLVGKAAYIWMHINFGGDGFEASRIGNAIN
ncbi:MAG: signal peptidase I [Gammaproteobacteria bacterium]|nr:signal peptidase I [Gammaproteobacteria bacterium]MBU1724403.1 signal peptidase I [Gammaproteobacteria bacterium]MBU2004378.1 signal peptidase I [Gammaproteobacteria bacterium]